MFQRVLYLTSLIACVTAQATTLKFCYESKELLPHYRGEGILTPSEKPGAAIEIMQKLDEMLSNVHIEFVREPWKRCLNDLKLGKVDALIARHSVSREVFAKYPKTSKNELDNERAISSTATCFIHKKNVPLKWNGHELYLVNTRLKFEYFINLYKLNYFNSKYQIMCYWKRWQTFRKANFSMGN